MKVMDEEAYLILRKEYSDDPEAAVRLRELRGGSEQDNDTSASGSLNFEDAQKVKQQATDLRAIPSLGPTIQTRWMRSLRNCSRQSIGG